MTSAEMPASTVGNNNYDLDWIVTVPNMDPWIRPFETLSEKAKRVED